MNERQRFQGVFRGEAVDRPPLFEEGVRDEVLARWHREGLPAGRTHLDEFGLTPHENTGPDLRPRARFQGRIMDLDLDGYRQAFDVADDRFPADWDQTVQRLRHREHVACLWASRGFFQALGVRDWKTFRPVMRAVLRDRVGVRARMEVYAEFCATLLDRALRDVEPDFIYLSEAISDNRGPLISPAMFEEYAIPVHRRLIEVARAHGCEHIVLSTYGNSALLFPSLIEAGVTIVWISEAAEVPDTDFRTLRRRFGPDLGLIGGIPLSLLRDGSPQRIPGRLAEIVSPLLESGRYVPLAGGRVRAEIPWEVYRCYREALHGLITRSPTDEP